MKRLVAAEIRRGRRRVVAPAVAIVIAVAFVTVTLGAMAALKAFFHHQVAARATLSDVVVSDVAPEGGTRPLPAGVAERIAAVPGVAAAEAVRGGVVKVAWPDGDDWTAVAAVPAAPRLRWMTPTSGVLPAGPAQIAVDEGTAHDLGVVPGRTLRLTTTSGQAVQATVTGLVSVAGQVGGLRTVVASPAAVTGWTDGFALEVDVLAAPGTDPAALRDRISAALASGGLHGAEGTPLTARTGEQEADEQATAFSRDVDVLGGVTLAFAAIALLVATIVIGNTFSAIFAQRARSLALLRCLGATRRQVFRAVLAETAVVGAVASLAGVLAGAAVVALGVVVLGRVFTSMSGVRPDVAWWMLAVPFLVGLLVSLLAAMIPARRATRVAPLAALRPLDAAAARRVSRIRVALGTLVVLLGTAGLALGAGPLAGTGGVLIGIGGGGVTLVGVLLVGPVVVPALVRLIGRLTGRWVPGRIAVTNAVRNPVRAASTSVALFVGVSLVTMMSVGAASATAAGDDTLQREYPLDLVVAAPDGGTLPDAAVRALAALPDTQASLAVPGATVTVGRTQVDVVGADPRAFAAVWRDADPGLRDGVALVPGQLLRALRVDAGGVLRLPGLPALTARRAEVPATVLTPGDLQRLRSSATSTGADGVRQVLLRARADADPSAYRTAVRAQVKGVPGARTEGAITQRAELADAMTIALRVVIGLLGAAVVIAIVGIANTLALSVLERSRELAVQRALGMTRRQLRASLTAEAVLLAVVGAVLGIVLGAGYGWAGARALLGEVSHGVPFVVPWGRVAVMAAVAVLAGVLASVLPGRRAARMAPVSALASE